MAVMERTTAPSRSYQQRIEALGRANEIRSYRADLKVRLKHRRVGVREVVLSGDPDVASMKLFELLLAAPKVGRVKAMKVLRVARVSPSKTVGGLSERQRRELAALLSRTGVA